MAVGAIVGVAPNVGVTGMVGFCEANWGGRDAARDGWARLRMPHTAVALRRRLRRSRPTTSARRLGRTGATGGGGVAVLGDEMAACMGSITGEGAETLAALSGVIDGGVAREEAMVLAGPCC